MRHVRECALCGHPEGFATELLSHLIGPIGEDARSRQPLWVHRECAIWSPEAFEIGNSRIRGISKALKRGRVTWCARCQKRGATMGCRLDQCPRSFHKYCAQQAGCTFYPHHYLIACKDHAHMYKADAPPERQTPMSPYSPYPLPRGLPAGQLTPGILNGSSAQGIKRLRHTTPEERMRNARRAVKRLRHETRVALAAGSDDEEHFQKKDKARLVRDKLRLNPVVLGHKGKAGSAPQACHTGTGQGPQPTQVEKDVVSEGWATVGGHASVIQQLKEMVLLPLQYPEVFKHMGITPPRGILFHGAPGSGKTLVARALAGACRHTSSTPVTLFARKGADCLGKFAGEAERTLRLLFDEAARHAPSIIFLDELDGLVPARSSNSSGGDQVFASVVSTLLALMDGVVDRGAVVVIGATNRPEAIDPALRRPGRFDREVHFGLPHLADRAAILKVHTGRWQQVPSDALLHCVAASTEGFAGADLQALCTATVMAAVARAAPTLVDQLCDASEDQEQHHSNQQQQQHLSGQQQHLSSQRQQHQQHLSSQQQLAQAQQPKPGQHTNGQQLPNQMNEQSDMHEQPGQHPQCGAMHKRGQQHLPGSLSQNLPRKLLEKLKVKAVDWQAALAAAPLPCSARQNMSALSSGHARAMPHHMTPLLLPSLTTALRQEQEEVQEGMQQSRLEAVLTELGAIQAPPLYQPGSSVPPQRPLHCAAPTQDSGWPQQPTPRPCKLLLCGEEGAGQSQVAGALLKLAQGVHVHTISLPMLVAGGCGDATVGLLQLLEEAMHRANSHTPLVLYLPTLEAWALETAILTSEEAEEGLAPAPRQAATGPTPQRNAQPSITPLKSYPASISPFRGLVSLQARQGGSGGSRGNPASSATPGQKATSTPARHLAFQQALPAEQQQPVTSGPLPDHSDPASPTLSLPSRRLLKAAMLSPKPDQDPLAGPTMSLPSPTGTRAAGHSPQPDQGSLASPTMSLPSPQGSKAVPTSPVQASQHQEAMAFLDKEREGNAQSVEVYVLSEIWKVFEQVVKQIPATQPLLVLAICQRSPEQLPPVLLRFFQSHAAVVPSAHTNPNSTLCNCTAAGIIMTSDVTDKQALQPHDSSCSSISSISSISSSSRVIVVAPQAASTSSWQEAIHRTAEAAANVVASAAASVFHSQLLERVHTAASQTGATMAGQDWGQPRGSSAVGQEQGSVRVPSGIEKAGTELQAETQHQEGSEPPALGRLAGASGHLPQASGHLEEGPGQVTAAGAERSAGKRHQTAVNKNDLQKGLILHAEVQRRLKLCGQQLLNDRRIKCAQAPVTANRADPNAARADPDSPKQIVSLAPVAQRAQRGQFDNLDAFAEAVRHTVISVCQSVEDRGKRHGRHCKPGQAGYSVRAAAACALGDDVTLWCHTASQQLSLADPANQRLLVAAQRHLTSEHQHSRQRVYEQRGRPAQLGREAAFASGLVTSSDDSSQSDDLNMARNAEVNRNVQNGTASQHHEEALDTRQTEQYCTTASQQLRGSSQGNEPGPGQGNCALGQPPAALRQAPGAPRMYSHSSENHQEQPALELAAVQDKYSQVADHQKEPPNHDAKQMPDFDQADDHARQAGRNSAATQHTDEQATRAAASMLPTTDAQAGQHEDNAAQIQLKAKKLSLQLRQKLQGSLPDACFAVLRRCAYNAFALQEYHEMLIAGVLEKLSAMSGSFFANMNVEQLACTTDEDVCAAYLQQVHNVLLKQLQTLAAGVKLGGTT
ncbi:hypothetical protein WJX77_006506 [Trebouxia sp. C0004]